MTEKRENKGIETDLGVLIENICKRPQMYTGSSKLTIVSAFIEGFAYSTSTFEEEIREFNYWLPIRLNFPRNWAWWSGLKKQFPNDEVALIELPKLFNEFRQNKSK